jgi:hypothetical protein
MVRRGLQGKKTSQNSCTTSFCRPGHKLRHVLAYCALCEEPQLSSGTTSPEDSLWHIICYTTAHDQYSTQRTWEAWPEGAGRQHAPHITSACLHMRQRSSQAAAAAAHATGSSRSSSSTCRSSTAKEGWCAVQLDTSVYIR